MTTWEHSVILLQSDGKEQSIEALEYVIANCNNSKSKIKNKTKLVHLSLHDLESQDIPEITEKKGKKGGKPQGATIAAMLHHWIKNDEIKGLLQKKEDIALNKSGRPNNNNNNNNENNLAIANKSKTLKIESPDIVYILTDFPSSVDDTDQLLRSESSLSILDGILQFVWKQPENSHSSLSLSSVDSTNSNDDYYKKNKQPFVLGGILNEIAAFHRLPHLEQAREAAAISRAAAKKLAAQQQSSNASAMLNAAMMAESNEQDGVGSLDDESGHSLADDDDEKDGFSTGKEVAGLEVRRKSFELPPPQNRSNKARNLSNNGLTKTNASSTTSDRLAMRPTGCNTLVEKIMEFADKNASFPAWADLSFDEVIVNSSEKDAAGVLWSKSFDTILTEFTQQIISRVTNRNTFRRWLRRVKHVAVPESKEVVLAAIAAQTDADAQVLSLDATRRTGRTGINTSITRRVSSNPGGGLSSTGGSGVVPNPMSGNSVTGGGSGGGSGNNSTSGSVSCFAVEGESSMSPWNTNKTLATYATLCSEVSDNVFSAGVALHCMVEAVVLAEHFDQQKAIQLASDNHIIKNNTSHGELLQPLEEMTIPNQSASLLSPSSGSVASSSVASSTAPSSSSSSMMPSSTTATGTQRTTVQPSSSIISVKSSVDNTNGGGGALSTSSFTYGIQEEEEDVLDGPVGAIGPGSISLDYGDDIGLRISMAEVLVAENDRPELARTKLCSRMMVRLERNIYEYMEFPRLRGAGALPLKPALSPHERAVERSELLTFCRLSPRDINITRQVMMFEEMLNSRYTKATVKNFHPWTFQDRDTFEKLPKHVFKQVLSRSLLSSPDVLKVYDKATDCLLVAVYHPTARHRCGEIVWHARDTVNDRPPFPKWSAPEAQGVLTPRSLKASCGMIKDKDDLTSCSTITTKLFPADHGLIVLTRHQSTPVAYLSCYKDNHIFGLRASPSVARSHIGAAAGSDDRVRPPDPTKRRANIAGSVYASHVAHFVCDFEDGYRLVVKEGITHPLTPTVSMSLTTTRGMILTANSDGMMTMRYISTSKVSVPSAVREEISRSVGPGGSVTRWLRNGVVHIYRADGSTLVRPANVAGFIVTNVNGTRCRAIPPISSKRPTSRSSRRGPAPVPTCSFEPLLEVPALIEVDPETGAKVHKVFGEDGMNSLLVVYKDGSKLAKFDDGTTIRTSPNHANIINSNDNNTSNTTTNTTTNTNNNNNNNNNNENGGSVGVGQFVLVEAKGFASVWIDKHVDKLAAAHSRGEKIPVSHGGEKIRTRIALVDGTRILTTYNTRITSDVRGKIILVRPDLTEVVASDSSQVESSVVSYRPRWLWMGGEEKAQKLVIADNDEQILQTTYEEARLSHQNAATDANDPTSQENNDNKTNVSQEGKQTQAVKPEKKQGGKDDEAKSDGCGVYEFNLFTGRLTTEDPEHNMFFASVNAEKCERGEKGATYDVDLAGKLQGDDTRAEAVVNDPIPPRLFIMSRDGNAVELLKPQDIEDFNHLREQKAIKVETETEEHILGESGDIPGKQVVHHILLNPPEVPVFAVPFPHAAKLKWHQHPLPVCCRSSVDTFPRAPSHVIAPRISVRRVWHIIKQVDAVGRAMLIEDLSRWEKFRYEREQSVNRFAVDDHRNKQELEAEANIQKQLEKAIKGAKMKKRLAEQKAREHEERMKAMAEATAAAVAAQKLDEEDSSEDEEGGGGGGGGGDRGSALDMSGDDMDDMGGGNGSGSFIEPSGLPPGIGGASTMMSRSSRYSKDIFEDEPLSPSTPAAADGGSAGPASRLASRGANRAMDGENREVFYQECEAAFVFYTDRRNIEENDDDFDNKTETSQDNFMKSQSNGFMRYQDVGMALVQVLNRSISDDEIKQRLSIVTMKTYKDSNKISFDDFYTMAKGSETFVSKTSSNVSMVSQSDYNNGNGGGKSDNWNAYLTRKISEQYGDFEGRLVSAEMNDDDENDDSNRKGNTTLPLSVLNPEIGSYWSTTPAQKHITSQFKDNLSIDDLNILNDGSNDHHHSHTINSNGNDDNNGGGSSMGSGGVVGGGGLNAARANRKRNSGAQHHQGQSSQSDPTPPSAGASTTSSTSSRKNSSVRSSKSHMSHQDSKQQKSNTPPVPPMNSNSNEKKNKLSNPKQQGKGTQSKDQLSKDTKKNILYKAMTSNIQTFMAIPTIVNFGRIHLQELLKNGPNFQSSSSSSLSSMNKRNGNVGPYSSTIELTNISALAARFRLRTAAFTSVIENETNATQLPGMNNNGTSSSTTTTTTTTTQSRIKEPKERGQRSQNIGFEFNEMVSSSMIPLKLSYKPRGAVPSNSTVMITIELIPQMLSELIDETATNNATATTTGGGHLLNLNYALIIVAEHQEIVIPINMQLFSSLI